jgi:NAD(P)-dependent dehydrogenase (short-subunit alcohol dehydrogenase family)
MLLEGRTAIVYGAAGAIGSSVAKAYAREGAEVHLAGRTIETLEAVTATIRTDGHVAYTARVDTLDRVAVEQHAASVANTSGRIDVCFNATSNDDVQGTPLAGIGLADFIRPVAKAITSQFHIATAAAPHMIRQGGGVILAMAGGREAIPNLGGSHVAWAALAGLCRQLAAELGEHGIRVVWLLSPGSPSGDGHDPTGSEASSTTGLLASHLPSYTDVANVAVFAASDWANTMTATEINITGGAVID